MTSAVGRAWAVCAKDAASELRRRIALTAVLFFAATALTLVSYAVGPVAGGAGRFEVVAALLWVILFFSAATGLPRAFVHEEETGTAVALRKVAPGSVVLAGKTAFNFFLFAAIAGVAVPGFAVLLSWTVASPGALALAVLLGGYGLTVVSTFLSALIARAGQKNVLFVVLAFPLLVPLLLSAIAATVAAARGEVAGEPLRVLIAYDGAATCAAYVLAGVVWEE